jgi:hypothetical protein
VDVELPASLCTCPLPDAPDTVAFMEGPVVLAGICEESPSLHGDAHEPLGILTPDNEHANAASLIGYRTHAGGQTIRFMPLYDVTDERYTVYFCVKPQMPGPGR